jgi:hypothetical protein
LCVERFPWTDSGRRRGISNLVRPVLELSQFGFGLLRFPA